MTARAAGAGFDYEVAREVDALGRVSGGIYGEAAPISGLVLVGVTEVWGFVLPV